MRMALKCNLMMLTIPERENFNPTYHTLLKLYIIFIFTWRSTFQLSDAGTNVLFTFIASFFLLVAAKVGSQAIKEFCEFLPCNIQAARKITGQSKASFERWVCCPTCSSLYSREGSTTKKANGQIESKKCGFVRFPNHPQSSRRQPCGTSLLKPIRTPSGTTTLQPRALYCYNSLINSLSKMIKRPDFLVKCEAWRQSFSTDSTDIYHDIFDGQVWKDFQNVNGHSFLASPHNYSFTLNVDWFQPFKRSTHSAGVIYLAIQNLPRKERYLSENLIVIGVIPGPKEPEKTVNSFLHPLVQELLQLWEGVVVKAPDGSSILVRAALTCVACDIPAARKVCGFLGHNALLGCSKCLKQFPTESFGQKPDFSGFDRSQ